jgi:hypothetical protein
MAANCLTAAGGSALALGGSDVRTSGEMGLETQGGSALSSASEAAFVGPVGHARSRRSSAAVL